MLSHELKAPSEDRSRRALHVLHRALGDEARSLGLLELFEELAGAYGAERVGLARLSDGQPLMEVPDETTGLAPWRQPEILRQARQCWGAFSVPTARGAFLVSAVHSPLSDGWLLWVEMSRLPTDSERAALGLVAQALQGWGVAEYDRPRWLAQVRKLQLEQQLDSAADVICRLAHDYGNVLTSILGFSELGLHQGGRDASLQRFLQEIHRSAEQGAQLTRRLRLCARGMHQAPGEPLVLTAALREECQRLASAWPAHIALAFDVPDDLPAVVLSPESLREVLTGLLDNAREAIGESGLVTVAACTRTLSSADCLDVFGPLSAGPCVEVTIADSGSGLTAEVRERLFREPFFTTKPRHRGLGLIGVYRVLSALRGGLSLGSRAEGGTTAKFYLPVAALPAAPSRLPIQTSPLRVGERTLVVQPVAARSVGLRGRVTP